MRTPQPRNLRMGKYFTVFRVALSERLVYRADFFISTFLRFIPIVTTILLWQAIYDGAGWPIIVFNRFELGRYPPVVELFAYHHECAHLTLPTTDEVLANCEGLLAMRRSGDITPALEATLRDTHYSFTELDLQYGGSGRAFWDATVECADLPLLPRR